MKLPIQDLNTLLDGLMSRFEDGSITYEQYDEEFDDILDFAGWTEQDYAAHIDAGWDEKPRSKALDLPPIGKKRSGAFLS